MKIESFESNGVAYFEIQEKLGWLEILKLCAVFQLAPLEADEYVELSSSGRAMLPTIYRTGTRKEGHPYLLHMFNGKTNTLSGYINEDIPFPVICRKL